MQKNRASLLRATLRPFLGRSSTVGFLVAAASEDGQAGVFREARIALAPAAKQEGRTFARSNLLRVHAAGA